MKDTKVCPKCQGDEIIMIQGTCGAYGVGNNILTGKSIFNYAPINRYLCCNCGYSEEWINKEDIPKIKKKYGK